MRDVEDREKFKLITTNMWVLHACLFHFFGMVGIPFGDIHTDRKNGGEKIRSYTPVRDVAHTRNAKETKKRASKNSCM